jgi:predicted phage terminase large subunit-like protein
VITVPPKGDKLARARAVAPTVEAGNVHVPGVARADGESYDRSSTPQWVQGFVEECASFPNAAHDDQVDACSQALLRLRAAGRGYRQKRTGTTIMGGIRSMRF